jgi:predicted alpha/beta-fold hydrolase
MRHEKGSAQFTPTRYRAAWWLPGRHAQTVAGRLVRRARPLSLVRERIELPDGDFVDVDVSATARAGEPLVLLLHGLEGSARRGYAINTYGELAAAGIGAIGLNFRSCSGEPNRLARSYHSGDTNDLRFIVDILAERYPGSPLGIIGFSLGGNVLLKWLGEEGDDAVRRVVACVAISVPYDLAACADILERSFMGRFYMRVFLKTLVAKSERKAPLLPASIDLAQARLATTFRAFDDAVTAPLHGFVDAADYYARSSSAHFLPQVRVPTLLLHAADDPFYPASRLPWPAIRANPALEAIITERGGHVGFVAGPPWRPHFWVESEAARFLAARFHASA